jgi:glycosyltransferase involved in cell wall biosynthesis
VPTGNGLKILVVVNTNRRRGAEVFAQQLTEGLAARGWYASCVSLTHDPDGPSSSAIPITSIHPSRIGRLSIKVVRSLRDQMFEAMPDVVLAMGGNSLRYCALALMWHPARFVYLGIGDPTYWIRSTASRKVNQWMLRRPDHVLAVSQHSLEQIVAVEPSVAGHGDVAYIGVPDEMFSLGRDTRSDGPLRVVVVGALSTEKNPGLALQTIVGVDGVEARFVGGGPLLGSLSAAATEAGVRDRVEFVGPVDNVNPHLQWANALLLTSKTEGLPGAVLEAGAAGLATVAVDVGGISEAVESGVSGLIVDQDDHQALLAAVNRLATDRELCRQMGQAARLRVKSQFSMDRAIKNYASLLSEPAK